MSLKSHSNELVMLVKMTPYDINAAVNVQSEMVIKVLVFRILHANDFSNAGVSQKKIGFYTLEN